MCEADADGFFWLSLGTLRSSFSRCYLLQLLHNSSFPFLLLRHSKTIKNFAAIPLSGVIDVKVFFFNEIKRNEKFSCTTHVCFVLFFVFLLASRRYKLSRGNGRTRRLTCVERVPLTLKLLLAPDQTRADSFAHFFKCSIRYGYIISYRRRYYYDGHLFNIIQTFRNAAVCPFLTHFIVIVSTRKKCCSSGGGLPERESLLTLSHSLARLFARSLRFDPNG